jgi:hypothetical protein
METLIILVSEGVHARSKREGASRQFVLPGNIAP